MSLLEKIEKDFQIALKGKDRAVIDTLRLFKSELIKKEKSASAKTSTEAERSSLTEEEVLQVLKSQIKQRQDSIVEYQKANREDLLIQEKTELEILKKYLPEQLSEDQIGEIVDQVLSELPVESKSNFGQAMGAVMKKIGGAADGSVVKRLVKEKLDEV